ncbi:Uncharacterized protein FWK35_00018192 [Aphis craccivora]|uniref:Uncharacterized protein n=1 Tax=Aphis craccivora TaxID=307492 RepID=A0A6G0Y732_APHCR|nr:Uncharacterized protein FWK35_00018192 [Aphis craccivora]
MSQIIIAGRKKRFSYLGYKNLARSILEKKIHIKLNIKIRYTYKNLQPNENVEAIVNDIAGFIDVDINLSDIENVYRKLSNRNEEKLHLKDKEYIAKIEHAFGNQTNISSKVDDWRTFSNTKCLQKKIHLHLIMIFPFDFQLDQVVLYILANV